MALLTSYWGLDGMILTIVAIVGAYVYMTRKFLYWKKRGFVEITPTPFTGNFGDCLMMKSSPGELFKRIYDQFSNLPYVGFYILDKPLLLVRDPEIIKHILVCDFNCFADRHVTGSSDDALGSASLLLLKNPGWRFLRAKVTPLFTSSKLKNMFELMIEVGADLENHLDSLDLKGKGSTLELKELSAKYATDLIGTTAFGLKVNSLNNPEAEFRTSGRDIFTYNNWRSVQFTSIFFAPQITRLMSFKFFSEKSSIFMRKAFWETIVAREKTGEKRNDLIDLLIELKNNQTEEDKKLFEFDGDNLVAQAAIFFTGGFETSSTVMSFALYELAHAPEVQNKLRKEIKEGLESNGGKITYEMVMNLPYLNMVVSESLRKYPPLPFLDRVANADYKMPKSNHVLEKGTPVYISLLGLHYDPEYFPNPDVFDPERFSEENKKDRKPFVYMPFGLGPHNCIAMRLGLLQSKLGLIHIISNHELSPCKETLTRIKFNPKAFLTGVKEGLYLNVRKIISPAC